MGDDVMRTGGTDESPGSEANGTSRVGVIGLGAMGRAVATCLIRAGRPLAVYDVRTEAADDLPAGTIVATRPSEVAAACDVVLIVVVDEAQVRAVLWGPGGVMESSRESLSIVVLSTIGVPALLDIAEMARRSGVTLLDCGVTGGDVAATSGVVSMVGGDESAVRRIRPVLDDFSSRVFHMGPLGAGMSTKLVRNVISYCAWHVVHEAGILAERSGVDLAMLADVIESSFRASGLTFLLRRGTMAPMDPAHADFDPAQFQLMTATVGLLHKDLQAAEDLAESMGVGLSVAAPTRADAELILGLPTQAAHVNGNGTTNTLKEA
jgi:3-hydroxyisobutyrate dehydrogenase-like beta-hydroxyacid dehydrogenase